MQTATKLQNTFKPLAIAHKQKEVLISDREMAIYNHVKLKLIYQREQAQTIYDAILRKEKQRAVRFQNITTRSIVGAMGLAILGMIIHKLF